MPIAQISGSAGLHGDFKEFSADEIKAFRKNIKAIAMSLAGKRGEDIAETCFKQARDIYQQRLEEQQKRLAYRKAQKTEE